MSLFVNLCIPVLMRSCVYLFSCFEDEEGHEAAETMERLFSAPEDNPYILFVVIYLMYEFFFKLFGHNGSFYIIHEIRYCSIVTCCIPFSIYNLSTIYNSKRHQVLLFRDNKGLNVFFYY